MKRITGAALLASILLLLPAAAEEPGITRQQADEILSELRRIRQVLERQAQLAQEAARQPQEPAPQKVKVQLNAEQMLGSPTAPITMLEFTDYQCPFCQRFHQQTFFDLKKNWIDTGKVRFYSRDFPLGFHPNALKAAEAARCAGEQNQFWRMRDMLASNPQKLAPENLLEFAKEIQIDVPKFKACLDSGKHKAAVEADINMAKVLGVTGTPSFIIGRTTAEGVEGEIVVGAMPLASFEDKLKEYAAAK